MKSILRKIVFIVMMVIGAVILKTTSVYAANIIYTDKEIYKPGETITVTYSVDNINPSLSPWIGLLPANITHGSEPLNDSYDISWYHLSSKSGVLTFTAPSTLGKYDFRFNDADYTGSGKEIVASDVFEVSNENRISVSSVSLNRAGISLQPGEQKYLLSNILPENASKKTVLWSSTNSSVVTVDNQGQITGVNKGEADIICTTINGRKTAVCHVYVTQAGSVLDIKSDKNDVNIGETISVAVSLQNNDNVIGEDILITYDSSKLELQGVETTKGVRLIKSKNMENKLNVMCSNKTIKTGKSTIMNLKFKTLSSGSALMNIESGTVSKQSRKVAQLGEAECGEEIVFIK